MSDISQGDPIDDDDSVAFVLDQQRSAAATALTSLDANPEDAARAQELSQATGTPPALVYGDLEGFEQQHKAALTAQLLRNNNFLAQYADSHPLAAKISNDDWGQLDTVSQKLQPFAKGSLSVLGKAAEKFKEGWGADQPWGFWLPTAGNDYRMAWSLLVTIGLPIELFARGIGAIQGGILGGIGEAGRQLGDEKAPEKAEVLNQALSDPGFWATMGPLTEMAAMPFMANAALRKMVGSKIVEAAKVVRPYAESGVEPPVGLHPLTDQLHVEQAKLDAKNLDDALKEAQQSATRERSPEMFSDFVKQHVGEARIGIDAEAVQKLYGDKRPEADDNILGWVPGIQEQYDLALAHGGDIEVPLADWLAHVDPEVAKELHDFIRVRPGGMTLEEAKGEKPVPLEEEKHRQPYGREQKEEGPIPLIPEDAIRQSAKLDPLFAPKVTPTDSGIIPSTATAEEVSYQRYNGGIIHSHTNFPLREGLRQIRPELLPQGIPGILQYTFSDRLSKLVGDVPVRVVSDKEMQNIDPDYAKSKLYSPAFYDSGLHEIYMSDSIANGDFGHAKAAELLIHEGGHALTFHVMRSFPELGNKVEILRKEFKQQLKDMDPELLEELQHAYAVTNRDEFWSQSIANGKVQHTLSMMPLTPETAKAIGLSEAKGKTFLDAVRDIIRQMLQKIFPEEQIPVTMIDAILHLQKEFEEKFKSVEAKAGEQEIVKAPKEQDIFDKAAAIGMTKDQYSRYLRLIEQRQAEDLAHQQSLAERRARETQTREWKENFSRIREEVQSDLRSRPDLAADRFLREGELYGEKIGKAQLAQDEVDPELRKQLPSEYLSNTGMHPDDVASLFGYQSGDALVGALARLEQERQLEGLTPAAHFSKIVDAETERRMRKEYGSLEGSIIEEAKDHVISQTQLDLLHEEMVALGTKAHGELTISKDDVKDWVKQEFNRTPLGGIATDKYLADAGRAGGKAEQALLEGKPTDAFKAKQQQYIALLVANEAKKLEKQRKQFDRLAKQYSKREVAGTPAEYTNWVHNILIRTGNPVRRSIQDLQDAISRETSDSLEKFAAAKNADARIWEDDPNAPSDFQVMPIAPFLLDPNYRKPIDEMTPTEFRAVHDSIKTLIKNGRDENKIIVAGEKQDLAKVLGSMISQLDSLFAGKEKQYAFGHKDQGVGHAVRTYWASLLQIESIFNRFDKGDPKGIFQRTVTQPNIEGSNYLAALEKKYARLYKEALGGLREVDLKKKVANPIFTDPLSGEKGPMTRGNLLAVLQNVGNPSQLDKLARGYEIEDKNAIMQWLFQNTTKEDWDRAQKLGDVFEQAFEESATMYHGLSGVAPEKIDIRPIQTPFGEYRGWYHPIIYDPLRPGSSKKLMGPAAMEDGAYYRAATPSGYTKAHTGYAAPILLSFDAIPFRLRQILNDIAMRPTVTETAKVFYDPKFQMAITKYYGKEIKDLLIPYLKDIAGQKQYKDAAQTTAQRILETARQNVIATLIGLNPSTVMKHGPTAAMLSIKEVGPKAFLTEVAGLLGHSDELGEKNWKFAMRGGIVDGKEWGGSEELQRRWRNWQETLTGALADVFGENTLRNTIIKFGATPVAISDLLSAVPTWLASYKEQIRAGETHGDAVAMADRAVRRAHGSSAVAARPRIMRGGALAQFATPFYTFFNEMFQRQYEMAWRAKDALGEFSEGDYKAGLKEVPNLVKGLWAYIVFPALIEQLVSPVLTGQEPTSVKIAGWGLRTVMSSLPGIRDLAEAFIGGRDPTVGLYSTSAKMLTDIGRDIGKGKIALDKKHAGTTIKHAITAFGAASGLTNAQEGRTAEFVYNYATGQERPKDIGQILRGLWQGTTKEQKR